MVVTLELRTRYQLLMVKVYLLYLMYLQIDRVNNKKPRNQSAFGIHQDNKIRKIFLLIEHQVCMTKTKHHGIRDHKYQRITKSQHKDSKIYFSEIVKNK